LSVRSLTPFLDELAARRAAPGAGAAAGAAAALAAALGEMAARYAGAEAETTRLAALRERALALADADAEAFTRVLETSGEERVRALSTATDTVLEIAESADEIASVARGLAARGKESLRGEALTAVALAGAAASSAARLALINLGDARDDERRARSSRLAGG